MPGLFFGGKFFGGGFFGTLPGGSTVYGGDRTTWKEWLSEKYRKLHARLVKEEKKLVVQKSRLETKIKVARKKNLPVDGILANYWKISERIDLKHNEIKRLEIEFRVPVFKDDDDEEDEEILFLNS